MNGSEPRRKPGWSSASLRRHVQEVSRVAGAIIRRPELPKMRFVIFSRGRSGSTLLVDLLNEPSSGIRCDGEIIRDYRHFPIQRIKALSASAGVDAHGCKILSYQIQRVTPRRLRHELLRKLSSEGYKTIYLERSNLLYYALSNVRARRLNHFHETGGSQSRDLGPIPVDPEEVLYYMREGSRMAEYERKLLRGLEYLHVSYEQDLQSKLNHQSTVDRICSFLDVPHFEAFTRYRRVSPPKLDESVLNAGELAAFLRHTEFKRFLDLEP